MRHGPLALAGLTVLVLLMPVASANGALAAVCALGCVGGGVYVGEEHIEVVHCLALVCGNNAVPLPVPSPVPAGRDYACPVAFVLVICTWT